MRILISAGHGGTDSGSLGADKGKEKDRTINLANKVAKYLKNGGHSVTVKQEKDANGSWYFKNTNGYDYALSIHFNAFNGTATGTECLYKTNLEKAQELSKKVSNVLGVKNRGAKQRTDLYMMNIGFDNLIEVCFHDNSSDLQKYKANTEKVAKTIADVINGGNINSATTTQTIAKPTTTGDITYKVYDNTKKTYLPSVTNDKGYAGNIGNAIGGIKAKCKNGNLYVQTHTIGYAKNKWNSSVTLNTANYGSNANNAYSGIIGKNIDCVKIWSDYGYVNYRVSPIRGNYYDWVDSRNRNSGKSNAYAGVYGKPIDRIQMK